MMKNILKTVLFIAVLHSCSNSDDTQESENALDLIDVTVLTETETTLFEHQFLAGELSNSINLTASLGLPETLERFEVNYPTVSFVELTEDENNFNIYQKNLLTSEQFSTETICTQLIGSEIAYHPIFSETKIGLFFYVFNGGGYPDFFLNILDKTTNTCEQLLIGNGGFAAYRDALVFQDTLLLKLQVGDNAFKLLKINLATNTIEDELTFDSNFWGTIKNDTLYILLENSQQVRYRLSDFSFESASAINFELVFASGLADTQIFGDELEVFLPYQQPSVFEGAPATISLSTGNYVRGDTNYLFSVKDQIENMLSTAIDFTTFATDIETNTVIFGYKNLSSNQPELGGIAYGTFEGEIKKIIGLEAIPFSIITN